MTDVSVQRGDVVISAFSSELGKPRPAVVVQSDLFNETHATVVLCPVSSELTGLAMFRVRISASASTGLRIDSEVMADKISAVCRHRIRKHVGKLSSSQMELVDLAIRTWLELGEPTGSNP
jgi:mRNA interferase MazF